jgi:hypothetical protein
MQKLQLVRKETADILPLHRRRSADTVQALEQLLDQARAGQLHGFMFVAKYGMHRHEPGATGEYRSDPTGALGAAAKLWQALQDAASTN